MITLQEAQRIAQTYAEQRPARWFDHDVVDRAGYWFFAVGFVGSCGIIIDKTDGHLHVMGSALSLEECFWAHENGFSPGLVALRITQIGDMHRTVELLLWLIEDGPPCRRNPNPKRAWLEERLRVLPCEFAPQRLWLVTPTLRDAAEQGWFEFQAGERPNRSSALPSRGELG